MQAIRSARPGGWVGYVGVPHGVELDGQGLFYTHVHLHGGPAPVRRFLPELIDLVWNGKINPAVARNNRIIGSNLLNQACAYSACLESILLGEPLKILFRQHRPTADLGCALQPAGRPGLAPAHPS
jgi:hypothetical protein